MSLCDDVVTYVELGWWVFPCQPRSKDPVTQHGVKEATNELPAVRECWARMPLANIGVACGPSELVVIDVDMPDGPAAWQALCEELSLSVETVVSRTPTGGRHMFFRAPEGLVAKNSSKRLGPGLDVRTEGGYVIVPPSVHPNGGEYRWEPGHSPDEQELALLPESLACRLAALAGQGDAAHCGAVPGGAVPCGAVPGAACRLSKHGGTLERRRYVPGDLRRYALGALQREVDAVRGAAPGGRNERLNLAAFALGRFVRTDALSRVEVEDELTRAALEAGLEPREVAATIRSGLDAGIRKNREPRTAAARVAGSARGIRGADVVRDRGASELVGSPQLGVRSPAGFPLTDAGNGELIAALYGDVLRFVHDRSAWLIWDGVRWRCDQKEKVGTLAVDAARIRGEAARKLKDKARRKAVRAWALRSESGHAVNQALICARRLPPIAVSHCELDPDPWLLGCSNGVVDLRTGKLRPARPEDLITLSTGVPFDPEARAPHWERFLKEITLGDGELEAYLRRAAGYSATGVTLEQVFFVCVGFGANGKSTFVNTLRGAFGEYAGQAAMDCFEQKKFSEGIPNDVAILADRRFVTATETGHNKLLHEQKIKQMTGGDPVTARFLHKEFFSFTPRFKLWMATNYRPTIAGTDDGIWRRVREIEFNAAFEGREDKNLGQTLLGELPGILAWVVRGCLEWQDMGLAEPACVLAGTQNYRVESDPVRRFLAECTEPKPGALLSAKEFYERHRRWCCAEGIESRITAKRFGMTLTALGYRKTRIEPGIAYLDVRLVEA